MSDATVLVGDLVVEVTVGSGVGPAGPPGPPGSGVTDGDKGDVVVSGGGAVWTISEEVLSGFALEGHSHVIGDVTGLQTALDSKQPAGSYAAASHTHTIANVTGLQTALDGKQPAGTYATGSGSATGANTGDETKATIDTKIGATGGTDFYRKDGTWAAAGGGVTDGDKGDIVVSGGGTAWTIDTAIAAALKARANHTGTQAMATISDLPVLESGTYSPTLTNTSNVDASSASTFKYMRVGNVVTVSGLVAVDPTASGAFLMRMSLPIASSTPTAGTVAGTASSQTTALTGAIYAFSGTAMLRSTTTVLTSQDWSVHFTYLIQ